MTAEEMLNKFAAHEKWDAATKMLYAGGFVGLYTKGSPGDFAKHVQTFIDNTGLSTAAMTTTMCVLADGIVKDIHSGAVKAVEGFEGFDYYLQALCEPDPAPAPPPPVVSQHKQQAEKLLEEATLSKKPLTPKFPGGTQFAPPPPPASAPEPAGSNLMTFTLPKKWVDRVKLALASPGPLANVMVGDAVYTQTYEGAQGHVVKVEIENAHLGPLLMADVTLNDELICTLAPQKQVPPTVHLRAGDMTYLLKFEL